MSKCLVVEAEWLLELLPENYPFPPQTVEQMIQEQESFTLNGREVVRPLTAAEEKAGDEENWVVVKRSDIEEICNDLEVELHDRWRGDHPSTIRCLERDMEIVERVQGYLSILAEQEQEEQEGGE